MIVEITDRALVDLADISSYTLNQWGIEQEEKYLREIWQKIEQIAETPDRFRFRPEFFENCQSAVIQMHVIYFRVKVERVEILRVLHGSMDAGTHLMS